MMHFFIELISKKDHQYPPIFVFLEIVTGAISTFHFLVNDRRTVYCLSFLRIEVRLMVVVSLIY